jgi:small redox-active disulfide protein 2
MISIKVLGPGCARCTTLAELAHKAAGMLGAEASIEKVTDFAEFRKYKILATPGLVINEKVVCAGRVPSSAEVTTWLTSAMAAQP